MSLKKINSEEFEKLSKSDKVLFVDFFATWCGPCQMMEPILDELAADYKNNEKVELVQVDVDENPALSAKYSVMSIPTMIILKGGEPVETMIGARSKYVIAENIDKVIK